MEDMYYTINDASGRPVTYTKALFGNIAHIKTFNFRSDDIVIASYPKTGTRWMCEMAWQVMHPEEAPSTGLFMKVPFLEMDAVPYAGLPASGMQLADGMASPRLIKTHVMPEFLCDDWLNSGAKFVVITRNPKDTLVSYFHFYKTMANFRFSGSWDEFYSIFKEEKLIHGEFFNYHETWWRFHNHPNVMFISYEELKEDHQKGVHRLGDFLRGGVSDEVVRRIVDATSIKSMREDKQFNQTFAAATKPGGSQFVRKGIVGDWKNYFTPEQNEYVEKLYREKLEPLGLKMKFEI